MRIGERNYRQEKKNYLSMLTCVCVCVARPFTNPLCRKGQKTLGSVVLGAEFLQERHLLVFYSSLGMKCFSYHLLSFESNEP